MLHYVIKYHIYSFVHVFVSIKKFNNHWVNIGSGFTLGFLLPNKDKELDSTVNLTVKGNCDNTQSGLAAHFFINCFESKYYDH